MLSVIWIFSKLCIEAERPEFIKKNVFLLSLAGDQEIPKPIIKENPESQNAFKGENMTLTCRAAITGEGEPTIQWKKDNVVSNGE